MHKVQYKISKTWVGSASRPNSEYCLQRP